MPVRGKQPVHPVDHPAPHPQGRRRHVEGLELDEQFVDDARHALPHPGRSGTRPARPDGIDLLDEADGAALAAGRRAEGLEVRADLAVGLPVVHGLEGRRGHEEERNARLLRHGLGDVGLAGPGWPLEQHGAPRRPAHPVPERLVRQEEVERLHDLLHDHRHALHVVEGDVDVLGAEHHVRGPAGAEQWDEQGTPEQGDEGQRRKEHDPPGRHLGQPDGDVGEDAEPQPGGQGSEGQGKPQQPALAGMLAKGSDIGLGRPENDALPLRLKIHPCPPLRSAGRQRCTAACWRSQPRPDCPCECSRSARAPA